MTVVAAVDDLVNWEWVGRNLDTILERTRQHLGLTLASVVIGLVVALGLALLSITRPRTRASITTATAVSYTIPSLAVFVFLVPFTGLGVATSLIGLSLYTLLILVRNTLAGLDGVPDEVLDAARGMGLDDRRILWRVQLPLAVPVIFGGIRIATVTTVGLVTVTALIGQGGLGWFILRGLNSVANRSTLVIVGVVLSVVLAVVLDVAIERIGRRATPWARRTG